MKILHLASLIEPLSDKAPGGAEQIAISLARGQLREGHTSEIIAVNGSNIPGVKTLSVGVQVGEIRPAEFGEKSNTVQQISQARKEREVFDRVSQYISEHQGRWDVVHNHCFDLAALFHLEIPIPLIHTLHCPPVHPGICHGLAELSPKKRWYYRTVSKACAAHWKKQSNTELEIVPNGVETDLIPFGQGGERYLWVGRISEEKGLAEAIELVLAHPSAELDIVGRVYDQHYFETSIAPRLTSPRLAFHGFLPRTKVWALMSTARALLFPLQWEEPFGLVVAESLAAGTPVITYPRGAMREIIRSGVDGFIVNDRSEFLNAMSRVEDISRQECRNGAVQRFSVERMVAAYMNIYEQVLLNANH